MTDSRTDMELAQGKRDEAEMLRRAAMTAPRRIEVAPQRFHMLIAEGQRAARELALTRKSLETSARLRAAPRVAQELLERAIGEYVQVIGRLEAGATAQLDLEAGNLEYRREQRAVQRTAFVSQAFKNVPQGAVDFFKSQVARQSDAQKLATYKLATDWQRLILAEGHVSQAQRPRDDSGVSVLQSVRGTDEHYALGQLIAEDAARGYKLGTGHISLESEEALSAEERALESARHELKMIDDLGFRNELTDRFKLAPVEPVFDARMLQLRQLSLERAAGQLGAAVPPAGLP